MDSLALLEQFGAAIAHELNNPLTTVVGYAQLLESLPEAERLSAIPVIVEQAQRSGSILRELLASPDPGRFARAYGRKRGARALVGHQLDTGGEHLLSCAGLCTTAGDQILPYALKAYWITSSPFLGGHRVRVSTSVVGCGTCSILSGTRRRILATGGAVRAGGGMAGTR